jgi:hypothetical protein
MYKWYSLLQRCSTLIEDSMKIKDVFAMIKDILVEMKDPNYEELKRMTRITMSFLNLV